MLILFRLITVGGYSLTAGLLGELFININSNNDNTQEYEIAELIKKNEKNNNLVQKKHYDNLLKKKLETFMNHQKFVEKL